jgi:hypothetical protein
MNEPQDGPRLRWSTLAGLLLACGAMSLGAGCSVFLTAGPPPKAQRTPGFTCTESPAWAATDIALSVLSLGEMIHAASRDRTPWPWLGASVAFGAAGGVGAARANACNKAHGHPYVPGPPAVQASMMPEDPFGMKGAHPGKPPAADLDDEPVVKPAEPLPAPTSPTPAPP